VRVLLSSAAAFHFISRAESYKKASWDDFMSVGGWGLIITDEDEWTLWGNIGDTVLHIELRRWADIAIVAPASADFISKICAGISDTVALSTLRAWDFTKPCVLCPAMNTLMWNHPCTEECISKLKSWGWKLISPISKKLACNDVGNGALAPVSEIFEVVRAEVDVLASTGRLREAETGSTSADVIYLTSKWVFEHSHDVERISRVYSKYVPHEADPSSSAISDKVPSNTHSKFELLNYKNSTLMSAVVGSTVILTAIACYFRTKSS
jgi:phosphopantothenoylcysteine decarboxylase